MMRAALFFGTLLTMVGAISEKIGEQVSLSKTEAIAVEKTRCSMCQAYVRTFYEEVIRLPTTYSGEEKFLDAVNAMCFGVLQQYSFDTEATAIVKFSERYMGRSTFILKKACEVFNEEYGFGAAEFIYKKSREAAPSGIKVGKEYCEPLEVCTGKKTNVTTSTKGKKKEKEEKQEDKEKAKTKKEKEKKKKKKKTKKMPSSAFGDIDPFESMDPEYIAILERMRDDPLSFTNEHDKSEIIKTSEEITCSVCKAMVDYLPRNMDEETYVEKLETICDSDEPSNIVQALLPDWLDKYDIAQNRRGRSVLYRRRNLEQKGSDNFNRLHTFLRACKSVAQLDEVAARLGSKRKPCRPFCTVEDEL
eukprot:GEMP01033029.1.p1 GENE.GEMP01033029.1~~GEMP01033029.1.p1  ORF type:complete len:361 (+),score=88.56 GEMP01033029.1:134-1216(+)